MTTSAITLRQLRVLLAVAEHGAFGRAGDGIGLSQPAVSQAIRGLEGALQRWWRHARQRPQQRRRCRCAICARETPSAR